MKKITIDLNVIIDFLNKRENHREAAEVFDLCIRKKLKGHVCAHEFTTLAYFLFKEQRDSRKVKYVLNELFDIFSTIPITESILRDAVNSEIDDYEDAVVEISSVKNGIDYIITRNLSDFRKSKIPALNPTQLFYKLKNEEL